MAGPAVDIHEKTLGAQTQSAAYLHIGHFAYHPQNDGVAERFYLEGLSVARGRSYGFYYSLCRYYLETRQWKRGRWCLEKALGFGRDLDLLRAQPARSLAEGH